MSNIRFNDKDEIPAITGVEFIPITDGTNDYKVEVDELGNYFDITTIKNDITSLEGSVSTNTLDIEILQGIVSTNTIDISDIQDVLDTFSTTTFATSSTATNDSTLTGTVSATYGSTAISGSGTSFTTQISAGDTIIIGGTPSQVQSVTNNTALVLTQNFAGATVVGATSYKANKEKSVTAPSFVNSVGNKIIINFTNKNLHCIPTLNINSSVLNLKFSDGSSPSINNPMFFPAGCNIEFISDGTNLVLQNNIVKTVISGLSSYSIRADGYKLQEGTISVGASATEQTINFPIDFVNINYTFLTTVIFTGAIETNYHQEKPSTRTISLTKMVYTISRNWKSSGY